jgi:hypothetical protein
MKRWMSALSLLIAVAGFAAEPSPQVAIVDGMVSVDVNGITMDRLLLLWDQATGMQSRIPAQLANRKITITFSAVPIDEAIRKIFETLGYDYVFIKPQGIVVTAVSQASTAVDPAATHEEPLLVMSQRLPPAFVEPSPPPPPPVIQTPFGPLVNSGNNPLIHLPPIPGEAPPPPFFAPQRPPPTAPVQDNLFRPLSIYQSPR